LRRGKTASPERQVNISIFIHRKPYKFYKGIQPDRSFLLSLTPMFNLSLLLYHFFQKRKAVFIALIVICCGVLGFLASKVKLEEDITRFVPSDKNSRSINSILENLKSKDKLILHFSTSNGEQVDQLVEVADSVHAALLSTLKPADYKDITFKIEDDRMQQVYDLFYRNLPLFLEEGDYARISGLIRRDSIAATLQKDYNVLLSPSGMVLNTYTERAAK
jgi:hypothetical protein